MDKKSNASEKLLEEMKNLIKQSNPNNFLMTVPEAAQRLSLTTNVVYDLINAGELNALKIKKYRISNAEINRFIEANYGSDLTNIVR